MKYENFNKKKPSDDVDFLEIFNAFVAAMKDSDEQGKTDQTEQKKSSYEELAKDVKEMYDAFLLQGFSVDQAFMLTETLVRNFTAK